MTNKKPFHRNYRPVIESENSGYSDWAYIVDHDYAKNADHYTRAFSIIQSDMLRLFEFIEPSDINKLAYSYRTHELLMRICIEIEANFKAILKENIFDPVYKKGSKAGKSRSEKYWNINDYRLINKTHHLDDYIVKVPYWKGDDNTFRPFVEWKTGDSLTWYNSYNNSKHNRTECFHEANFENLIKGFAGLFVLLSSQFRTESFSTGGRSLGISTASYFSGNFGLGGFLMVKFPADWAEDEKYEFNWTELKEDENRFNKIDYNKI